MNINSTRKLSEVSLSTNFKKDPKVMRVLRVCSPVFWRMKSEKLWKTKKIQKCCKLWKFWVLKLLDRNFFSNVYFDKVGIDFEFWRSRKTVLIGPDPYLDLKNHKFSISVSRCAPWSFTYPALCLTCLLRTPLSAVNIEHVESN